MKQLNSFDQADYQKLLAETQRIARTGTWEVDLKENIVTWSDILREIYEVGADFLPTIENSLQFYKEGEDRDAITQAINEALEKGSFFDIELSVITAMGNARWLRSTGKAEITNGICTRIYGVTQDITKRKAAELALLESRDRFQSLVQTIDGIVWEADAETSDFTFVSDKAKDILGYTPQQWLDERDFWANHIHPDDREYAINYCHVQTLESRNHTFDYRMIKADGTSIWVKDIVSVINDSDGKPKWLRGIIVDITQSRLLTDLDHLEKTVLELSSKAGTSINEILDVYMRGIEVLFPHMHCSILQIRNNRLYNWAAPSLPKAYIDSIENLEIGDNVGSCGTAAFLKQKVIVSSIQTDPRWKDYKHLIAPYELNACWSYPILNTQGNVIAVFGIYYKEERYPNEEEVWIIESCGAILKIILENRLSTEALQETTVLMEQGQELAGFGNWQWDIQNNVVTWSDVLYTIYGLDKKSFNATFEAYQELLHPDDRQRVYHTIRDALQMKKGVTFEERIIRPNGEVRYLRSWGRVKVSEAGIPVKMIGACLDITENKLAESQLQNLHHELEEHVKALEHYNAQLEDILWTQSHIVRAPLARIMGLIDLLKNYDENDVDKSDLLGHIVDCANEFDDIIRNITNKSELMLAGKSQFSSSARK